MGRNFTVGVEIVATDRASSTIGGVEDSTRRLVDAAGSIDSALNAAAQGTQKLEVANARLGPQLESVATTMAKIRNEADALAAAEARAASASTAASRARSTELQGTAKQAVIASAAIGSIGTKFFQLLRAATVFSVIGAAVTGLVASVAALAKKADDTRSAFSNLGEALVTAFTPATAVLSQLADRIDTVVARAVNGIARLIDANAGIVAAFTASDRATQDWARAIGNVSKLSGDAVEILNEQGVSLETVNGKIREHEAAIRTLTTAYDARLISEESWRAGTERLRGAIDELRDSAEGMGPSITVYRTSLDGAAESQDALATSTADASAELSASLGVVRELVPSLTSASTQIRLTAADFDRLRDSALSYADAVTFAIEAGAQLTLGGTRVRFGAYGSVLARPPGLTGLTSQRRTSSLSPNISGGTFGSRG